MEQRRFVLRLCWPRRRRPRLVRADFWCAPSLASLVTARLGAQLLTSLVTTELVRKLNGHEGFVKGLVFDPVGQYLATQADDNSLKVWRTDDWRLQADVREPFVDAPKATVIRPAWSPDGAYIITPNSMNGPVFCAAVVDRNSWTSPSSLIGHQDIVQCAAYCPLLFLRDPTKPVSFPNVCSLLALCAQGTISLWFTDTNEPFAVVADLFDRDVLDLSWSRDGTQLWASSSDGQVAVLAFDVAAEFAPVAPRDAHKTLHAAYGYVPPPSRARPALSAQSSLSLGRPATPNPGEGTLSQPKVLLARKGPGAKRPRTVQLAQPAPLPAAAANPFATAPTFPGHAPPLAAAGAANAYASTSAQPYAPPMQPGFGAPGPAPHQPVNDLTGSRKRKASLAPGADAAAAAQPFPYPHMYPPPGYPYPPYPYGDPSASAPSAPPPPPQVPGYGSAPRLSAADYRLKGHTLGAGRAAELADEDKRELVPAYALYDREVTFRVSNRDPKAARKARALAVPAVVSFGKLGVEDSDAKDTLEWRNFADGPRASRSFSLLGPRLREDGKSLTSRRDTCRQGRERGDGHVAQEGQGPVDRLPAQVGRVRGGEPGLYGRVSRGRELGGLESDGEEVRLVSTHAACLGRGTHDTPLRQAHSDARPRRTVLVPRRRGPLPPRLDGARHPHRVEPLALDPQAPLDLPAAQHLFPPLLVCDAPRRLSNHHDERAPPQRNAPRRPLDGLDLQLRRRPRELDARVRALVGAQLGSVGGPQGEARRGEPWRARHRQEHRERRQRGGRRGPGAQGTRRGRVGP